MPRSLELFLGTLQMRPYVFLFLAAFLVIARTQMGWLRTLVWIPVGYAVAYASEVSSIHNGFPYGDYQYLPAEFSHRELWIPWWTEAIKAVPFFDSLSYVFLSYVAYQMAVQLRSPARRKGWLDFEVDVPDAVRYGWGTTLLAGFLMTMLDVVIDPVAHMGDRWFLGRIYYYPQPGPYFGVPLANFAGWFLVGSAIVRANQWLGRAFDRAGRPPRPVRPFPGRDWMPAGLYFGIFAFNLGVTFWLREEFLGITGCFVAGPILVLYLVTVPGRATG